LGTVSAAADELGVHRATVIRPIDAAEARVGAKLFQRHARGYTPTEAGGDLERVARTTQEPFDGFAGRARGRETQVSGQIVLNSVEIIAPWVARTLARVRAKHPERTVRDVASGRVLELAYGEAQLSIRAGTKPDHPDNAVRPFLPLWSTFYAHRSHVEEHGLPATVSLLSNPGFVSHEDPRRAPFFTWLELVVPERNIVLRSTSQRVLMESVLAGIGIGFMPVFQAAANPELQEVMALRADWSVPLWLVTHVDLHRTAKVRAVGQALSEVAEEMSG
jgi:DNA-binding transcriptional LysR family regulator